MGWSAAHEHDLILRRAAIDGCDSRLRRSNLWRSVTVRPVARRERSVRSNRCPVQARLGLCLHDGDAFLPRGSIGRITPTTSTPWTSRCRDSLLRARYTKRHEAGLSAASQPYLFHQADKCVHRDDGGWRCCAHSKRNPTLAQTHRGELHEQIRRVWRVLVIH